MNTSNPNQRIVKAVGVITVPLSPQKKYFQVCGDSYISTSHILWLEQVGFKVVPIPYDTTKFQYYMDRIHGLYLPSGGVFAGNNNDYYQVCKKFVKLAMEANDRGEYFPIWGGCLGMQQLMIIAEGRDDMKLLEKFDSYGNLYLPLVEFKQSRLMQQATKKFRAQLTLDSLSLHNHMMGLSPEKIANLGLDKTLDIVHISYDRKNQPFVSTIEFKKYPFYGVQWHPERDNKMDYFVNFFYNEVAKNAKKIKLTRTTMDEVTVDCMTYSDQIYNYCTFYWHSKSSKYNSKLCSVLNLGLPTENSV